MRVGSAMGVVRTMELCQLVGTDPAERANPTATANSENNN